MSAIQNGKSTTAIMAPTSAVTKDRTNDEAAHMGQAAFADIDDRERNNWNREQKRSEKKCGW